MIHPLPRQLRGAALILALLLAAPPTYGQRAPAEPNRPRLLVILVVDQMRADYVHRFERDWSGGLKRLFSKGAWFTQAAYPYLETYTCAGHATIATGSFPHVHGIIQNAWYDAERGANMACTDDPSAAPIPYSGHAGAHGPRLLQTPTLADELRAQRPARIVSVALKARSAIMLAGHGGDAVTWMSETNDGWQTSTAFAREPVAAVKAFVDANPVEADYGKVWTRSLPPERYREPDDGEAEAPGPGWTPTFPHALTDPSGIPGPQFYSLWQRSPYADEYVGRLAASLAEHLHLGRPGTTDVLAVSFSSPDLVGHQFGPSSQEIHDMYVRLDRTLGRLLARLDSLVGRDHYVVALSADHGVTEIPEQLQHRGVSAGRLASAALTAVAQRAAESVLGPGNHVARVNANDVYFHPGAYERLQQDPAALASVVNALASQPGIARVFRADELEQAADSSDLERRAAALSYVAGRSGALVLSPRRGWVFAAAGATHGSATPEDQRVPLVFMGRGIRPGSYAERATPADLAPTLAALIGLTLPQVEGRALTSVLRLPGPRQPPTAGGAR